jgi:hypothetical protein
MQPASFTRSYLATVGLAALLGAAALAQQAPEAKKYLLKNEEYAVGDVSTVDLNSSIKMEMFVTPQGVADATPRSFNLLQDEREKYTETVLAVGKDGITQLRRVYSVSRTQRKIGPDAPLKTVARTYQGKTVTIKRVGEKVVVTLDKGKLAAADLKELQRRFGTDNDFKFFPDHEVGPGDEWAVDESLLKRKFGAEQASLKAKFVDVVPFEGQPCAHITMNLQMVSKAGKDPLTWDIQGETYYALALGRTLSSKLSGPLNTKGTANSGGTALDIEGLGTGAFSHTQKWLKVGGKAPAPQP